MTKIVWNRKTSGKYIMLARGVDSTNARDGKIVVVYAKPTWRTRLASWLLYWNTNLFVREVDEFNIKFTGQNPFRG